MKTQFTGYQSDSFTKSATDKCTKLSRIRNIPEQLQSLDQWVGWQFQDRESPTGPRRIKVPVSTKTGRYAKVNDPSTWTSFKHSLAGYDNEESNLDGIGFVFSRDDPFVGIDLDDCLDEQGNLSTLAQQVITEVGSYTEVSPSGKGVKVIAKSLIPVSSRRDSSRGIEIYGSDRFFTITGNAIGCHPDINDCTVSLPSLIRELFPDTLKALTPNPVKAALPNVSWSQVQHRARGARNGDKFMSLILAKDDPKSGSASEGDLALCSILAFWTGPNHDLIDQIFRLSKRYRPKWDERHFSSGATYGEETINRAIAFQNGKCFRWPTEFYRHLQTRTG